MTDSKTPSRVVLCILDGYGWRDEPADNAVRLARTPVFDRHFTSVPHSFLRTDGEHVGLPAGQFGNSEVGHLNLGAGRVVMQDLPRIDQAIADGLDQRAAVKSFIDKTRAGSGRVHVLGLLSPGGVHAHQRHMAAIVNMLAKAGLDVVLHVMLDGRDTPPRGSVAYWRDFKEAINGQAGVTIGTVAGRYYAMDRDQRWERTELAYAAIAEATGPAAEDVASVIKQSHAADITDEFVKPHVIAGYAGAQDGDALLCINFRADRVRQIMAALTRPDFDGFARPRQIAWSAAAGMTSYSDSLDEVLDAWVPTPPLADLLGDVIAGAGLRQLRMAETEKYPHVTFFFNGGTETALPGEERIMVPSPKVATYDLQPEMSAGPLTDACVARLANDPPDFLLINFANPDMVGHTGDLEAAIKAVETVDHCLGRLIAAAIDAKAAILVTADHGNCELMRDPDNGGPHTSHTTNPVPLMLVNGPVGSKLEDGRLADIAPSVLDLLNLPQPSAMTGRSLLVRDA